METTNTPEKRKSRQSYFWKSTHAEVYPENQHNKNEHNTSVLHDMYDPCMQVFRDSAQEENMRLSKQEKTTTVQTTTTTTGTNKIFSTFKKHFSSSFCISIFVFIKNDVKCICF